jgi:ASC-1-like (ASCH) protein
VTSGIGIPRLRGGKLVPMLHGLEAHATTSRLLTHPLRFAMNYHLVILKKPYLDLILAGEKTIELRLTRARRPACGRVQVQDWLFLKQSGGPVCGLATVKNVQYYEGLTPEGIRQIQRQYNDRIRGDDAVWENMMDRRSGFLVWLTDVRRIDPIRIAKQDWRAWVVLTREKNFGLLQGHDLEGNS